MPPEAGRGLPAPPAWVGWRERVSSLRSHWLEAVHAAAHATLSTPRRARPALNCPDPGPSVPAPHRETQSCARKAASSSAFRPSRVSAGRELPANRALWGGGRSLWVGGAHCLTAQGLGAGVVGGTGAEEGTAGVRRPLFGKLAFLGLQKSHLAGNSEKEESGGTAKEGREDLSSSVFGPERRFHGGTTGPGSRGHGPSPGGRQTEA